MITKKTVILLFITLFLGRAGVGFAQDFARLGERTIMGTARYVGMGGAMTAVGADPSAALDNPAGLGLYRRSEFLLTLDYMTDKAWQKGADKTDRRWLFMAPNASAVFCVPTQNAEGVLFHNFMVSYQRVHTFNRTLMAGATNAPSLGTLFASTEVDLGINYCSDRYNASNQLRVWEIGYVNAYAFDWSVNISDRWYVGLGLRVHSFSLSSEAEYTEYFDRWSPKGATYYNANDTKVLYTGAGCSLSAGLLYRPVRWLRLGFGLQTPSVGSFTTSTVGTLYAQTDTLMSTNAPDLRSVASDFHMPLHTSLSMAFQIRQYALIALQYDFRHQPGEGNTHSLRAGVEVVPVAGLYINAGYVYESPFRKTNTIVPIDPQLNRQDTYFRHPRWSQYISGAVGYRGEHFIVQAAYQFRMQRLHLTAHENMQPFDMQADTHRVVLTFGWHR